MKELATEVLIVGAGPSGLVLANDLCRRQTPFILVDQAESPPQESRALFLQPRSLEVLGELGVLETLLDKGLLVEKIRLYRDRRLEGSFELETVSRREAPYPFLLVVEQHVTESVLVQKLRQSGVVVERGWKFQKLQDRSDQVRAWLQTPQGEQLVRSNYLVGADGANSSVRRVRDIAFTKTDFELVYQLADLELQWELPPNEVVRLVHEQTEVIATPLPGKYRYRLSLLSPAHTGDALSFSDWEDVLQKVAPCDFSLSNPRRLKSYRAVQGLGQSMSQGRVFLLGDAAHVVPQGLAQGLNLGLQDAYNLGWKLAMVLQGDSPPSLLESYSKERRQVAQAALIDPSSLSTPTRWASFLESPKEMARWSKIDISPHRSTQRGDRAPDGELISNSQTCSLYERLDGLGYQLLVFSNRPDTELDKFVQTLAALSYSSLDVHRIGIGPLATVDIEACLHRAYSAKHGDLVLIRPDRLVAMRTSLGSETELLVYLAEHLVDTVS